MAGAILYQNQSSTVLLLDVPTSIRHGQKAIKDLRSSTALESPYPSTEPKGTKRETALATISPVDLSYHESIQDCISKALNEIQNHQSSAKLGISWCHSRRALSPLTSPSFSIGESSSEIPIILSTTERRTDFHSLCDLEGAVVFNFQSRTAVITTTTLGDFFIPPQSTFILASLEQGLSALLRTRDALFPGSPGFDLILMDPPWSNRSVRHSGAYRTQESQNTDPFQQAFSIAKRFVAPRGWLAVWITNKSIVRAQVLQACQISGFYLHEEWVWIKTTTGGEPVTQLDGIWRRPYEILLLFRQDSQPEIPKRRIIAGVPDVHSRKPCLKVLLEELLPPDYSALELFARSLTAGWWSWGDEVLKFQHESSWSDSPDHDPKANVARA